MYRNILAINHSLSTVWMMVVSNNVRRLVHVTRTRTHTLTDEQQPHMVHERRQVVAHARALLLRPVGCGLRDAGALLGPREGAAPHLFLLETQLEALQYNHHVYYTNVAGCCK